MGIGKPVSKVGGQIRAGAVYNSDVAKSCQNTVSRYPIDLIQFEKVQTRHGRLHPTQKPVALMEYLIRTYTNEGGTVLDNCAGSGTTGVACMNTGRKFIGIERDPEYFRIAKERIEAAAGKAQDAQDLLVGAGEEKNP